jgi:hypothetical protein
VDVEKGRENAGKYAEERKLLRVAKETGLTTDQVIDGVATGVLGVAGGSGSGSDSVEFVGVETGKKMRAD